jgi:hypothetical protein
VVHSLFPGKNDVLPAGCLYSLRVWLRANGVDRRLFGEDELWLGADPDFGTVENTSFARLWPGGTTALGVPDAQVYDAVVGCARVQLLFGGCLSHPSLCIPIIRVLTAAS